MVVLTAGLWLLVIPFYPARCINCGLTRSSATKHSFLLPVLVVIGLVVFGAIRNGNTCCIAPERMILTVAHPPRSQTLQPPRQMAPNPRIRMRSSRIASCTWYLIYSAEERFQTEEHTALRSFHRITMGRFHQRQRFSSKVLFVVDTMRMCSSLRTSKRVKKNCFVL